MSAFRAQTMTCVPKITTATIIDYYCVAHSMSAVPADSYFASLRSCNACYLKSK